MRSSPVVDASKVLPRLERLLAEVVVPYWFGDKLDPLGGFRLNHGTDGEWRGRSGKSAVSHARMTLAAARLAREADALPAGIDVAAIRAAADHGFAALRDLFWDADHDGVLWEIDAEGKPPHRHKHLLAQATALGAFAEYARATGSEAARDLARRTFARIEHARDRQFGGYVEVLAPDWSPAGLRESRQLGFDPELKLAGNQLHVLIAFTHYAAISDDPLLRERLRELLLLITTTVIRHRHGCPTEAHTANWRSLRPEDGHRVSYGHMIEMAWWAPAAAVAAGIPPAMVAGYARALLDKAIDDAVDHVDGGVHAEGPADGKADRRGKHWWVQMEALRAFGEWHRWSDDLRFASVFLDTLGWIETRQVAGPGGDFHATVRADGTPAGDRASQWKCPYHQVVSLLGAIRVMYADAEPFAV